MVVFPKFQTIRHTEGTGTVVSLDLRQRWSTWKVGFKSQAHCRAWKVRFTAELRHAAGPKRSISLDLMHAVRSSSVSLRHRPAEVPRTLSLEISDRLYGSEGQPRRPSLGAAAAQLHTMGSRLSTAERPVRPLGWIVWLGASSAVVQALFSLLPAALGHRAPYRHTAAAGTTGSLTNVQCGLHCMCNITNCCFLSTFIVSVSRRFW